MLLTMCKSDLLDKMKLEIFQAVTVAVLVYGCTNLAKQLEKKLGGDYSKMLHTVMNKLWKQHPAK